MLLGTAQSSSTAASSNPGCPPSNFDPGPSSSSTQHPSIATQLFPSLSHSTQQSPNYAQRSIQSTPIPAPSKQYTLDKSFTNISRRAQCPAWMTERHNTFRKGGKGKSKKVKISMWEHEFICIHKCGQIEPPSPMEKAELIRAGLGPRKLSLFEFCDSSQFHEEIISAYPKLINGGGYELMRTKQNTNRELCVIPPPSSGYTVEYIKSIVSQAKVYIRPIQKDLSLIAEHEENDEMLGSAPSEMCMQCGNTIPMHQLRQHLDKCRSSTTSLAPDPPTVDLTESSASDCESHSSSSSLPNIRVTSQSPLLHKGSPSPPPFSPITPMKDVPLTALEEEMISKAIKESLQENLHVDPQNLEEVILALQRESGIMIPSTDELWSLSPRTTIDVRRSMILKDGLREGKKARFDPTKLLKVHFVGEEGIDTGGPSREFWRLFVKEVVDLYCIGEPGKCLFIKNVPALQVSVGITQMHFIIYAY